jgi:iron complex outermembrane receptor protein
VLLASAVLCGGPGIALADQASSAASASAAPTAAASAATPAAAVTATATAASTTAVLATAPSGAVQEVVVTANKRKESVQNVPIVVQAITAAKASAVGVTDISSLQTTVPGLEFPRLFSGSSPALRGVGSSFGIGGEENEVALYIDDVYIASASVASALDFNNIDQIEVLYGPQGTLFGRNAMAGVINITTRNPSMQPAADVTVGYANYDTYSGSFYGNIPLSDKVMTNLAVTGNDQVLGWGKNLYTGLPAFTDQDFSIRNKWLIKPDDLTTITLIADYSWSHYDEGIAMRPVQGSLFPDGQVFQGFYNVNENVTSYVDTKQGGLSAKIDRDLGFADLISITAWRKSNALNIADEDQSILPSQSMSIPDDVDSVSEELRMVSKNDSKLQWLVGFFYFYDKASLPLMDTGTALGGLTLDESFIQTIDSYAGFGQATYALPAGFHLTLGARFTYDDLAKDGHEVIAPILDESATGSTSESAFTYKVNLEKDLTSSIRAYVGYSTGFKGGIYNDADITAPAVKPETLDDIEGGFKSELFDDRLRLNAAVYHYDYNNLQVTSLTRAPTGQTSSELENAAQATNTGFELSFDAVPIDPLTVSGGIEIMHSRFTSFPDATISVPLPGGGNTTVSGSAQGFMVPHSPDFSGNLTVQYRMTTAYGMVVSSLNGSYESQFAWDADNRLKQKPYGLLNGSIEWMPDDAWLVKLWAKNITNTHYSIYTTANVVGDEESPAPPMTVGISVTRHFF